MSTKTALDPASVFRQSFAESIVPPRLLRIAPAAGRAGIALGLGAGLYGIGKLVDHLRSSNTWESVKEELGREKSLTPDEIGRAQELFGIMRRFAPSLAADKRIAKGFVASALTLPDEGVWSLVNTLTRSEREISDIQPSLSKPVGLVNTVAQASKSLLGPA